MTSKRFSATARSSAWRKLGRGFMEDSRSGLARRTGVVGRHGAAAQLVQKAENLPVRHVLALVVAIVMNDLAERAADRRTAIDGGEADRQDVVDHQEVGDSKHTLERLLHVNGDVLRA